MTNKERLVKLLEKLNSHNNIPYDGDIFVGAVSTFLDREGVIVPKFKVGQDVWYSTGEKIGNARIAIIHFSEYGTDVYLDDGEMVFFRKNWQGIYSTEAEAEQALKKEEV